MTVPLPPQQLPDADLWEYYRARGLSPEDATLHVERRRSAKAGQAPPSPRSPTVGQAALVGAGQGATLGFGDELIASLIAAHGPRMNPPGESFTQSRERHLGAVRTQGLDARLAHPLAAIAGNVAGSMINPLARLLPAPVNATKGAVTGAVLGGVQGLGEGEGSLTERLPTAGIGTVAGGVTGGILGGTVGKLVNKYAPHARNAWNAVIRKFGGKAAATPQAQAAAEQAAETAVRVALQKAGKPPEVIEQVIDAMRQQGKMPVATPPQPPMTVRPGETITPISPHGLAVEGPPPPLKQGPFPPTIAEMQGFQTAPQAAPQQAAARNAYNYMEGLGANPADATAGARRAAGAMANVTNWDPRQALILMLLAGQGQRQ